jgi:hypothetical protein
MAGQANHGGSGGAHGYGEKLTKKPQNPARRGGGDGGNHAPVRNLRP